MDTQHVGPNGADLGAPMVWDGEKPLPKRNAPRGLLPSTWLNRAVKVEYADASGVGRFTTGTLVEVFPFGPILRIDHGARTALSWDRLILVELEED